jgi:hypothetical protein
LVFQDKDGSKDQVRFFGIWAVPVSGSERFLVFQGSERLVFQDGDGSKDQVRFFGIRAVPVSGSERFLVFQGSERAVFRKGSDFRFRFVQRIRKNEVD